VFVKGMKTKTVLECFSFKTKGKYIFYFYYYKKILIDLLCPWTHVPIHRSGVSMILSLGEKMNMLVIGVQWCFADNVLVILKLIADNLTRTSVFSTVK